MHTPISRYFPWIDLKGWGKPRQYPSQSSWQPCIGYLENTRSGRFGLSLKVSVSGPLELRPSRESDSRSPGQRTGRLVIDCRPHAPCPEAPSHFRSAESVLMLSFPLRPGLSSSPFSSGLTTYIYRGFLACYLSRPCHPWLSHVGIIIIATRWLTVFQFINRNCYLFCRKSLYRENDGLLWFILRSVEW
jgi:hypothetical protein